MKEITLCNTILLLICHAESPFTCCRWLRLDRSAEQAQAAVKTSPFSPTASSLQLSGTLLLLCKPCNKLLIPLQTFRYGIVAQTCNVSSALTRRFCDQNLPCFSEPFSCLSHALGFGQVLCKFHACCKQFNASHMVHVLHCRAHVSYTLRHHSA